MCRRIILAYLGIEENPLTAQGVPLKQRVIREDQQRRKTHQELVRQQARARVKELYEGQYTRQSKTKEGPGP